MTMNIDLDQLEATARAATAGVWEVDRNTPFSREIMGIFQPDEKRYVVRVDDNFPDNPPGVSDADAAHIAAARPEVVLALIERLRTAEAALSTPPADDVREALARRIWDWNVDLERAVLDDAREIADGILAVFEVRPHGTVTEIDDMPGGCVYCSSSGVIEDYEGDRPCSNCDGTGTPRPHGTVTEAECAHEAWESIGVARRCADCRLLIPDAITCTTNHLNRTHEGENQ